MTFAFWPSRLSLPNTGIMGLYHHSSQTVLCNHFECDVLQVQTKQFSYLICALCQVSGQTAASPSASQLPPVSMRLLWHSRKHRKPRMDNDKHHRNPKQLSHRMSTTQFCVRGGFHWHITNQPRKQAVNFHI